MILFYYGPDTYSISEQVTKLKAQYPLVEELEFEQGATAKLREVLQSQGLFAQKKLVVLRGWVGELQDLPFSSPPHEEGKGEVAVLFFEPGRPDKRLKFFKWLVKNAETKEFIAPTGPALAAWIKNFAGNKIDDAAVKELMKRIGEPEDLWQYAGELEKLMLFATAHNPLNPPYLKGEETTKNSPPLKIRGEGGVISAKHIRQLVSQNFHDDVFAITNAFAEGRVADAAAVLTRLPAEPVQVVGSLASQLRSLLLVKSLAGKSPAQIAKILSWKEGRVWINQRLAAKFSQDRLIGLLQDLLAIDRRIKTSEEPPKLLLTLFLQKSDSVVR